MSGRHNDFKHRRTARHTSTDAVRLETYPHPFPDGWYRVMRSARLRRGEVRHLECLGRQLVAWRGKDGQAHVMNAFCPHLGAKLSLGRVCDDSIECPFHRWRFTGDGRAVHVPYSDHVPSGILTETFPVAEVYGDMFMYHRCSGPDQRADEAAPYPLPSIAEVDDGTFVFRGRYDAGRIGMHLFEFSENAVDRAHFQPLHGQMRVPWTQLRVPGVVIEHSADWKVDPVVPWKMYFYDEASLRIFGRRVERAGASARITFFGPGSVVKFRFTLPGKGEVAMYQTHLPVGPLDQQVDFQWFADRRLSRWLVWYLVGNWISQWAQDIEIWENKIFQKRPRLCRDDGPVFRLRQWYAQFIPEEATGRLIN